MIGFWLIIVLVLGILAYSWFVCRRRLIRRKARNHAVQRYIQRELPPPNSEVIRVPMSQTVATPKGAVFIDTSEYANSHAGANAPNRDELPDYWKARDDPGFSPVLPPPAWQPPAYSQLDDTELTDMTLPTVAPRRTNGLAPSRGDFYQQNPPSAPPPYSGDASGDGNVQAPQPCSILQTLSQTENSERL
eukprot:Clim_evm55s146 gene=Clim_evmTU55s146